MHVALAIRTDAPEAHIAVLIDGVVQEELRWHAHRELASTILHQIDTMLANAQTSTSEITGIYVFEGPGSFTGLRIGISVANALAYSYDVPVIGVNSETWLANMPPFPYDRFEQPVMPLYGAEPHITTPKK